MSNTDLSFAGHKFSVENLASGLACSYGGIWTAFGWETVFFWSGFFHICIAFPFLFMLDSVTFSGCPVCLNWYLDPVSERKLCFNTAGWAPSCRTHSRALCAVGFTTLKGASCSTSAGIAQARCL